MITFVLDLRLQFYKVFFLIVSCPEFWRFSIVRLIGIRDVRVKMKV